MTAARRDSRPPLPLLPTWPGALCAAALALALAGCTGVDGDWPRFSSSPTTAQEFALNENFRDGTRHFKQGAFGLAEASFQKAVEQSPGHGAAWLGLAASYDQLRRFDLADRAYAQAEKLMGDNLSLLNNIAYSRMLRGDTTGARKYFERARAMDPNNAVVLNNLALLESGGRAKNERLPK